MFNTLALVLIYLQGRLMECTQYFYLVYLIYIFMFMSCMLKFFNI